MKMKYFVVAFVPAIALCLNSCQQAGMDLIPPQPQAGVFATVPAPVNCDPDTRGISINSDNEAIFGWIKDVDNINVFSSRKGESMIYSIKEVSSEDPKHCRFLVEDFALKTGNTYYGFYPSVNTNDPSKVLIDYTTQRQYALDDDSHLPAYSYMLSQPVEASDAGANFEFSHKSAWITFKILAATDIIAEKIVVSTTTQDAFVAKGTMNVVDGTVTPTKSVNQVVLYLGEPEEGLEIKGGIPTRAFMALKAVKTLDDVRAVLYGRDGNGNTVERIVKEISSARSYPEGSFSSITLMEYGAVAKAARIGDTYYDTVAEAVAAAETGETVEIVAAGTYTVPGIPKNITIKGDVSGVVFDCVGSGSIASVPNGATFEDVAFNFGQTNYHGFQHAGTINMNGCTLNGLLFSYGAMNFNDCIFNQDKSEYMMWDYGTDLTYTDCVFNGKGKFINVYAEGMTRTYNLTATGCTFNSDTEKKAAFNVKETCGSTMLRYNVVISNCTATGNFPAASDFVAANALWVIDPVVQVDDRNLSGAESGITVTLDGNVVYPVAPPAVARIDSVEYASLAEAIAAIPADGTETTVTMLDDEVISGNAGITVSAGQNIILDLNGKTLSNLVNENKSSQVINNKGTLTVKNGVVTNAVDEGTNAGEWWGTTQYNYATNVITNTGTLVIDGAEIYETAAGSICYAIDNNSSAADAICTIESGYIHKDSGTAIRMFCNSTVKRNDITVNGGTIDGGYSGIWVQLPGNLSQQKLAHLTVNGGVLKGSYAFYDYTYGDVFDCVKYDLNGGSFDGTVFSYGANVDITGGTYSGDVAIRQALPSSVSVTGGKFSGDVYCYGDNASTGFITGGVFSINTYEYQSNTYECDWCSSLANGLACVGNTDPATSAEYPWTVGEAPAVAKIGSTAYGTFEAAVQAAATAKDGVPVELLSDVTYAEGASWTPIVYGGGAITIDGHGHTVTGLPGALFEKQGSGSHRLHMSNIVFDGAKVNVSGNYAAVIIGDADSMNELYFENVTVRNSVVTSNKYAAAFVGYAAGYNVVSNGPVFQQVTFKNCTVENNTISGAGSTGALMGHAAGNPWAVINVSGTIVKDNTITCTSSDTNKAGSLFGTVGDAGAVLGPNGEVTGLFVTASVSGNAVRSGGTDITTVCGRQGSNGGRLVMTAGGSYDARPYNETDAWASCIANYELTEVGGKWTVSAGL